MHVPKGFGAWPRDGVVGEGAILDGNVWYEGNYPQQSRPREGLNRIFRWTQIQRVGGERELPLGGPLALKMSHHLKPKTASEPKTTAVKGEVGFDWGGEEGTQKVGLRFCGDCRLAHSNKHRQEL